MENKPTNSLQEQIVTLLDIIEEKIRAIDEPVQFPVQIGNNHLSASVFGIEEGKLKFGLFLGKQRYSRKTLEISEDGTVEEDKSEILPDFDKTDHEPDFSGISDNEIAAIVLGKLANTLGFTPAQ